MSIDRLLSYIERIRAASDAADGFTKDMTEELFLEDARTQMAVMMALVLVGEAVAKIAASNPEFIQQNPEIAWSKIKGMRNLIAHDYYEVELPVVWKTIRTELPLLVSQLERIRHWQAEGE